MKIEGIKGLSELTHPGECTDAYNMMNEHDVVFVDDNTGVAYQFDIRVNIIDTGLWIQEELEQHLASA